MNLDPLGSVLAAVVVLLTVFGYLAMVLSK